MCLRRGARTSDADRELAASKEVHDSSLGLLAEPVIPVNNQSHLHSATTTSE